MVNKKFSLFLAGLIIILSSCNPIPNGDYHAMILDKENGFCKEKIIGDLAIEVLCKPAMYSALVETRGQLDKVQVAALVKEYESTVDFNLRIGPSVGDKNILAHQISSKREVENRIKYFSYQFENDIRLIQGNREWRPVLYHFERSYDLTPHKNFTFSFPKSESDEPLTLLFNSKELGLYNVKFKFDKDKI